MVVPTPLRVCSKSISAFEEGGFANDRYRFDRFVYDRYRLDIVNEFAEWGDGPHPIVGIGCDSNIIFNLKSNS